MTLNTGHLQPMTTGRSKLQRRYPLSEYIGRYMTFELDDERTPKRYVQSGHVQIEHNSQEIITTIEYCLDSLADCFPIKHNNDRNGQGDYDQERVLSILSKEQGLRAFSLMEGL